MSNPRKPWLRAFWTLSANPQVLNHPKMKMVQQKYKKSAAQIFFHALIKDGIIPLTGTTNNFHMKESLEVFDFEIDETSFQEVMLLTQNYGQ